MSARNCLLFSMLDGFKRHITQLTWPARSPEKRQRSLHVPSACLFYISCVTPNSQLSVLHIRSIWPTWPRRSNQSFTGRRFV